MPELPEVEVTRLGIAGPWTGAIVREVRLGKPLRWPLGIEPQRLVGLQGEPPWRRGKYLWLPLRQPTHDVTAGGLLIHLGMSGTLQVLPEGTPAGPHDHVDVLTDRGLLRLHDPRRFGAAVWGSSLDDGPVAKLLAGLGVEPFSADWTAERLRLGLQGRRVAIKQALLAGDIVVGVGNIYASEVLFRAGIHPRTPAHRVGPARCQRLVDEVRTVLGEAVRLGGSTLRDFRDASGQSGHFQLATRVYDREGQPCLTCGTAIRRIVQGQRSTWLCPRCQRP